MNKSFSDLKVAVVGIPGKWSTEVLADEIEAKTGFRLVVDIQQVKADYTNKQVWFNEQDLCELDGIIIKKISETYSPLVIDRLEILRFVEACGVQIFSKPDSIIRLVDRLSCTTTLANAGIPMPPTTITEDLNHAYESILNYEEVVIKPLFSTKARGMEVLTHQMPEVDVKLTLERFRQQNGIFYIQQKLNLPGKDLGLVFLDGEYQGSYARVSANDSWNTTIHSGGKYAAYEPNAEIIEIAQRAQAAFNLSYTTVDMAETAQGPICFEVSAFGGFKGAQQGLNLNMAEKYCQHVLQALT